MGKVDQKKNSAKHQRHSDIQAFLNIRTGEIGYSDGMAEPAEVSHAAPSLLVASTDIAPLVKATCVEDVIKPPTVVPLPPLQYEPPTVVPFPVFLGEGRVVVHSAVLIPSAENHLAEAPTTSCSIETASVEHTTGFYSCFISHSHYDKDFVEQLVLRMRSQNLHVWFAPEEMQGGKTIHEQIYRAIQRHDKLLLILSDNSMKSGWVKTEILRAKKAEHEENRRKLFPIRLVSFEAIQKWECFDPAGGKDLAIELCEYYIPDFSNWKDHDAFEIAFTKLLRALSDAE